MNHEFSSLKFFADRLNLGVLIKLADASSDQQQDSKKSDLLDRLQSEFLKYKIDSLPDSVLSAQRPIDSAWHEMSMIVNPATGKAKYRLLSAVMKSILTIFHSNADCERLFSSVRKNKTDFRATLSTKTLSNLLVHKTAMESKSENCYTIKHSDSVLAKAKSATYVANYKT